MKYIIYARKSTEEDDRQILSIEAQLVELKNLPPKKNLKLSLLLKKQRPPKNPAELNSLKCCHSWKTARREGIISWHPDRLARNSVDGGRIIHFVDRGLIKSLKFPTFWFEPTPQGLFMLNIAFRAVKILRGQPAREREARLAAED